MKKIMFNDKYGLTDAVLQGRKTMTRRIVGNRMTDDDIKAYLKGYTELADKCAYYKIGDVVAVAQRGIDIYHALQERYGQTSDAALGFKEMYEGMPMWNNKMFVPADLCPSRIRITDIKVERLQDISDEDCIAEGIINGKAISMYTFPNAGLQWGNPRLAFSALIDKVSGKGTWERNPYISAYSFELD